MDKTCHVCVVAPVHKFDDVRIYTKEISTLLSLGFNVTYYARNPKNETIDLDINFVEVPTFRKRASRFINLFKLFFKVLSIKADVYHIHNPDTLPIGFLLKMFGKKVIYDTHEDFSKRLLMREWIPSPIRKIAASSISQMEKLAGKVFNAVIVTQTNVKKRIGKKAIIIENAPVSKNMKSIRAIPSQEGFRVIYVGSTLSKTRGIKEMVDAVHLANEMEKGSNITFTLVGSFDNEDYYKALTKSDGWKWIEYKGFLPQKNAFELMAQSHIGLITILDVGDHSQTSPNKIFEYQMFGLPFIASDFESWRNKLENTKSGFFVNPANPEEIASYIVQLYKDRNMVKEMGQNGREYIQHTFNWEIESEKIKQLYKRLLN
ncbi:glycosyltransferase family 4 protein [Aquibacillus kalidii]|uniref:glycosyltransferase family 4 protein n=1 Tax=Aquibacillus kalidii TaxID=2762597 RepID=UPI001644D771|nr:glycosyltransferase family 4 protein [Aquibacillus kalidii]